MSVSGGRGYRSPWQDAEYHRYSRMVAQGVPDDVAKIRAREVPGGPPSGAYVSTPPGIDDLYAEAECHRRGIPVDAFFPDDGHVAPEAVAACEACPVAAACDMAARASATPTYGVWAAKDRTPRAFYSGVRRDRDRAEHGDRPGHAARALADVLADLERDGRRETA